MRITKDLISTKSLKNYFISTASLKSFFLRKDKFQILKSLFYPDLNSLWNFILGFLLLTIFAPFHLFPVAFLSFSLLAFKLYKSESYAHSFRTNFYFFLGFFLGNFYWISFSFLVNRDFILLFPIAFIFIPSYFAIFSSLFLSLIFYLKILTKNRFGYYLLFSGQFLLHEILRGNFIPLVDFTGLPWNLIGYSFAFSIKASQMADVIGIYGLSFIAILMFSSGFFLIGNHHKKHRQTSFILITNLSVIAALYSYGDYKFKHRKTIPILTNNISLLHSNFSEYHGYDPEEIKKMLEEMANSIKQHKEKIPLLILPEGALVIPMIEGQNEALNFLLEKIGSIDDLKIDDPKKKENNLNFDHLIVGSARIEGNREDYRIFNSLFLLDANQNIENFYDKLNLVPFGEYNPYLTAFPNIATKSNFSVGHKFKIINLPLTISNTNSKISFVPLICYDVIFPGKFAKDGDFLLNLSNDIWFTKKIAGIDISTASWQSLDIARFRSIEEGKPLIKVSNYGVSGVIDSFGRVQKSYDYNGKKIEILDIRIPPKLIEPTFFNQHRNLLVSLVTLLFLVGLIQQIFSYQKRSGLTSKNLVV